MQHWYGISEIFPWSTSDHNFFPAKDFLKIYIIIPELFKSEI